MRFNGTRGNPDVAYSSFVWAHSTLTENSVEIAKTLGRLNSVPGFVCRPHFFTMDQKLTLC